MRKITHRVAAVVAAFGLAILGIASQPAEEASAATGCSAGQACFWDGFDGKGVGPKVMSSCIRNWATPYNWDNRASSIWNAGVQDTLSIYTGAYATGNKRSIARGSGPVNLTSPLNNNVSSAYFKSYDNSKYWTSDTCK